MEHERIHFTTSFRFQGITSVWEYQKDPLMEESSVPLAVLWHKCKPQA
jgi:hypothetical protein